MKISELNNIVHNVFDGLLSRFNTVKERIRKFEDR